METNYSGPQVSFVERFFVPTSEGRKFYCSCSAQLMCTYHKGSGKIWSQVLYILNLSLRSNWGKGKLLGIDSAVCIYACLCVHTNNHIEWLQHK